MKKLTLFVLFVALVFFSCKKPSTTPNSGIYSGTFTARVNGVPEATGNVTLALFENGSSYALSGDTTTGTPLSHGGTWSIQSGSIIYFTWDKGAVYANATDSTYLLDSAFTYTFNDVNFSVSQIVDSAEYTYELTRF